MANPWDNDPIAGGANPWEKDLPINADPSGGPGMHQPTLPSELQPDQPEGLLHSIYTAPAKGLKSILPSIEHMAQPGMPAKYEGATGVLKGAAKAAIPFGAAALVPAAIAAPIATAAGVGVGMVGSEAGGYLGKKAVEAAGGGQEAQGLGEEIGSNVGGVGAGALSAWGARALGRAVAKGFANSALGTTAKTRAFDTNPGEAALQETTGVRPSKVAESAGQRMAAITPVKERYVAQSNPVSLEGPRQILADGQALAARQNNKTLQGELASMQESLSRNFATGEEYPDTVPASDALDLLRGFGNEHVRFIQGRTSQANDIAKRAWGSLRNAIRENAPETAALDKRTSNLVPARDLAVRADNLAGPVETGVNRMTRPTGGMIPAIAATIHGGPLAGAATLAGQEALTSPTVKMGIARGLWRGVGGERLSAPDMPMAQIAAPVDASGSLPQAVADFRSAGAPNPLPQPKLLPAATSPIGVSGTIAPDISGNARRAARRMNAGPRQLPAAMSGIGVSGTPVPDIIARGRRGTGQGLLPPPAPGQPPLNILPRGPAGAEPAIGPAGTVPLRSTEAPIPLPPISSDPNYPGYVAAPEPQAPPPAAIPPAVVAPPPLTPPKPNGLPAPRPTIPQPEPTPEPVMVKPGQPYNQDAAPLPGPVGNKATVYTPGDIKMDTQYRVVPLDSLKTSFGGDYPPELQPRNTSRTGSAQRIADPAVESMVKTFSQYGRNAKAIGEYLRNYADLVEELGDPKQAGMFGPQQEPTKLELLEASHEVLKRRIAADAAAAAAKKAANTPGELFGEAGGGGGAGPAPGGSTPAGGYPGYVAAPGE